MDGISYRKPRPSREQAVREEGSGLYVHWREALVLIAARGRGYDTFLRYKRGFVVGGELVRLATSPRPSGCVVSKRAITEFIERYEKACERAETAKAAEQSQSGPMRLKYHAGEDGAEIGRVLDVSG